MKRKSIRLLVLGDQGVGKTSLIYSIMSEVPGKLVRTLKKVILPPEMCMYSKEIFTEIVDTDVHSDYSHHIEEADLILLVYDVTSPESIVRIENHWLPIVATKKPQMPVILVGNKLDKKEHEIDIERQYTNVRSILKAITKKYRQVQMGLECSAYYDRNVKKVLNCSQRAVLYPLTPLYDLNTRELTPKFKRAIKRIFRILDKDLDGRLSDNELRSLQERVFQTELNMEDIKSIKQIIIKELEEFNQDFINLDGFYALQKKCIQMLKIQVCWSILRYFNYGDDLDIVVSEEEKFILDEQKGETLELTQNAIEFIERVYTFSQNHKREGEGAMEMLFSCSPRVPIEEFRDQNIDLERFISHWYMFTLLDYKQCYHSLLYIGYEDRLDATFRKVKSKKSVSDLQKLKERKFFSILIVENDEYQKHLNLLFKNGIEDEFNIVTRQSFLHSMQPSSKILLMIKVHQKNLVRYLEKSDVKQKIDLVLSFDSSQTLMKRQNVAQSPMVLQNFHPHTMHRKLSHTQCQRAFQISNLPSLDLQKFPVQYKDQNWKKLFDIIIETFHKYELGYEKGYIEKLKKQNNDKGRIFLGLAIASSLALAGYVIKKGPKKILV